MKSIAFTDECADCSRQTSVTAGTIMHASKLPLTIWFWAAFLMATRSNGSSANSVETAVLHRVYLVRNRVPLLRYGAHAGLIS